MIYVAWVAAAADDCTVVLLAHFDGALDDNAAPFYHYVVPGGPAFSGLDLSSTSLFGTGAMEVTDSPASTECSVWLNDDFDPIGLAFNGNLTIDFGIQRIGGMRDQNLSTSESGNLVMELVFGDYDDAIYFVFGHEGPDYPVQSQGTGFRIFTEMGPSASGIYKEATDEWSDNGFHRCRLSIVNGATAHFHIDGVYQSSASIGPMATSGLTLNNINYYLTRTFPTNTDVLRIDELRVMLGRALSSTSDYTPATGAWADATCDSDVTAGGWVEIDFVTTSDAAASDALGSKPHSICLSRDGSVAVIGCPTDDSSKGAAYVFTRSGDVWTEFAKLTGSDSVAGDEFGSSVAISGDGLTIAVGAPLDDISSFTNAGSTYIFRYSGGSWSQQTRLGPSGGLTQANKQMGFSVALSEDGNTCASGSPGLASNNGGAYVHIYSGGSWSQQAQLLPSSASGQTGRSIAITSNGNYIAAGGPFNNSNAGAVQTWSRSGTTWTFDEAITRTTSNQFGQSVSIDDTGVTLIIGSNSAHEAIYTYAASTWTLHTSLGLGTMHSVTMSGDGTKAAVAYGGGSPGLLTYELSAGVWNLTQTLPPVGVQAVWMAKDGAHMGITDPTDDTAASNAGAAYFFKYT